MKIPSSLFVGDSATWDDDPTVDRLGNPVDSTLWTLKYVISGATALTLTATPKDSGWETVLAKTDSATLGAGDFYWQAYVENGSDRFTLGSGRIRLTSAAGNAVTGKSQAQQDLDAVQLAMRTMISGGAVAEYTIGGRSLRKLPLGDLMAMEAKLKSEVAREKKAQNIANGLGNPSNVFVRFK